jgi:excisionase family DNA binding protein
MTRKEEDLEAYIESAFLDADILEEDADADSQQPAQAAVAVKDGSAATEVRPRASAIAEAVREAQRQQAAQQRAKPKEPGTRRPSAKRASPQELKHPELSAPRPRKRKKPSAKPVISAEMEELIKQAPKNLRVLAALYDDEVTEKYYSKKFKEPRDEFIRRLIDPVLNLEETARLLGVCPATVRRYTNRGWLEHHRTPGNQRRFRLSDIVRFVDQYGRHPE